MLDNVCSPVEFLQIVKLLPRGPSFQGFYRCLTLASCSMCANLKIRFDPPSNDASLDWLNEFSSQSGYFSCCYKDICRECVLHHIIGTIEYGWWHKLGSLQWLDCPGNGCDNALGIRCEADLQVYLERSGAFQTEKHMKMWVTLLRSNSRCIL